MSSNLVNTPTDTEVFFHVQEEQAYDNFLQTVVLAYAVIDLATRFLVFFETEVTECVDESIAKAMDNLWGEKEEFMQNLYQEVSAHYVSLKQKVPSLVDVNNCLLNIIKTNRIQKELKKICKIIYAKNKCDVSRAEPDLFDELIRFHLD